MIYHVTTKGEWENSSKFSYSPSSFAKEGFIHCCSADQLEGVLHRYFSGKMDLLLLKIDPGKLTAELKFEPSTNQELFAHIYGPLNKDAVIEIERLR